MALFNTLGSMRTATGAGSGFNIQELVDESIKAQTYDKTKRLDDKELLVDAKLSGFGRLKSSLADFRSTIETLRDPSQFNARSATVANDPTVSQDIRYFTATANSNAMPSTFDIEVEQLARSHKFSKTFATEDTIVGTGTLTVTVGEGQPSSKSYDIVIDENNNTVAGIKNAINDRTVDIGVCATIITTDDDVRLIISSNNPGIKNTLGIAVTNDGDGDDGDDAGLSQLIEANMVELSTPLDAQIKINGQTVTTSTNTLVDTIEGITLTLLKAEDGKVHTLKVDADKDTAIESIKKFVSAYNSLKSQMNRLTASGIEALSRKYTDSVTDDQTTTDGDSSKTTDKKEDATKKGDLFNDPLVRSIEADLNAALTYMGGDSYWCNSLQALGITSDRHTGYFKLDEARLANALGTNFDAVGNMLGNETTGVAARLYTVVDNFVKHGGLISKHQEHLDGEKKIIGKYKEEHERKMKMLEIELTMKYTMLDQQMGYFRLMSDRLTQQLASIPSPGKSDN